MTTRKLSAEPKGDGIGDGRGMIGSKGVEVSGIVVAEVEIYHCHLLAHPS